MNNAGKHMTPWSAADVQKYLNGELSAREMHDLEQQALDDPFLADALEGLQTQPVETLHQDLAGLRTRLEARVATRRKTIVWPVIRVAAAVILLVGLGFTAFYTFLDQKHLTPAPPPAAPVAANPTSPAAASPAKPAPSPSSELTSPALDKPELPASARSALAASAKSAPSVPAKPAPSYATREPQPIAGTPAPEARKTLTTPSLEKDVTADSIRITAPAAEGFASAPTADNDIAASRVRRPSDTLTQFKSMALKSVTIGSNANLVAFSGRVLDLNHRPLAGASLMYRSTYGTFTGVVTDQKGQFNLYVPQKDTTRQLTVAMEGYEEIQYALNTADRTGNTIYLRPSPARLDEVVVSGVGAKRKEYFAAPPSDEPETLDSLWLNTAPALGRIAYLNYLATALKTLPVDTTIHGTESISFLVDKKGALSEFKIERSLSPAHDAGVIRLISEGPPWKMVHGRTARALVNVSFP
jgi:hypothetical protein